MLNTATLGTVVTVPEGQALYAVHTLDGVVFVIAENASLATATLLRAEVPVLASVLAR
jgi:hypothetical protein